MGQTWKGIFDLAARETFIRGKSRAELDHEIEQASLHIEAGIRSVPSDECVRHQAYAALATLVNLAKRNGA